MQTLREKKMPGSGDKFAKDCKRSKSVIGKIALVLLLGHMLYFRQIYSIHVGIVVIMSKKLFPLNFHHFMA